MCRVSANLGGITSIQNSDPSHKGRQSRLLCNPHRSDYSKVRIERHRNMHFLRRRFFARLGRNAISVYEAPDMGLLDKKSVKLDAVQDFSWSPADPVM